MTKIVYFGNERLVSGLDKSNTPILIDLIESGYDVVAIIAHHTDSGSRNKRELEVAKIAKKHNIPLLLPNRPLEILDDLRAFDADIAVLVSYGRIISQNVINIFPKGIINVHPSLLPRYRGPTPIESALQNGDNETGVSIMQLSAGIDEGPVYAQARVQIEQNDEKFDVYKKIVNASKILLHDCLPQIIEGTLEPIAQKHSEATYSKIIHKSDGNIDWDKSATHLANEIRAFKGWPQSRTKLGDIDVIITKAHTTKESGEPGLINIENNSTLVVNAGNGQLSIDALKPLGKKEMPITAFLAGYKSKINL